MANCDTQIAQSIERNCEDPYVKGIERIGYAVNRSDIEFGSLEFRSGNELSTLPLKSGAKGYSIYQAGAQPFNGSNTSLEDSTVAFTATHSLSIVILDDSPEVSRNFIDPLMNGGELVVILEKKYKKLQDADNPGGSAFKVFGLHQGCKLSEGSVDPYSDDTNGGWSITLTETGAPKSAMFLNAGSYEATKALLESLL